MSFEFGCYNWILEKCARDFSLSPEKIKKKISHSICENRLKNFPPFTSKNPTSLRYNGILYDAFSQSFCPPLWSQDHWEEVVENYASLKECHWATFASTGALKRALKNKGFCLEKRKGFGSKREATLAHRGLVEALFLP